MSLVWESGPLGNPMWTALHGPQLAYGEGTLHAARYRSEVAAFAGLREDTPQAWADLTALTPSGELAILFAPEVIEAPAGWTRGFVGNPLQMVQARPQTTPVQTGDLHLRELTAADVDAMLELAALTRPGPFLPRTPELGLYLGVWDESGDAPRLAAMAGQRAQPPGHREISAVCTHPDYRRRGLARTLVAQLAAHSHAAGEVPFLHVNLENEGAIAVYRDLGFEPVRQLRATVLKRD
ncbi:GNAT family N-acetyltransferase [Deinococcus gobiensis]|nr:GNAT family N-acetyltransferase [Deinococcus gobiensis]